MQKPLVSICCITYNHENYIQETLDSFLMQKTNFPFKILIGEDESPDNTRKICQEYEDRFPEKIKLFLRSRKDVIHVNGRPTGRYNFMKTLEAADSKYIAVCEGDDYWTDPLKLQKQVDFMEKNEEFSICYTTCKFSTGESSKALYTNSTFKDLTFPFSYSFANSLQKKGGATLTMLFRKKDLNLNLYEKCSKECAMGDWPLECVIMVNGKGHCLEDETGVYRIHGGGASATSLNILKYYHSRISFCENLLREGDIGAEQKDYLQQFLQRALFLSFVTNFHFGHYGKSIESLKKSLSLAFSAYKRREVRWIGMYKWSNIFIHLGKVLGLKMIPQKFHKNLPNRIQYTHK